MRVRRALVVGAGIGGLAAATALARSGVEVDVAEVSTDGAVYGVGINLPANSLRALRSLGALDPTLDVGFTFDRIQFFDWRRNPIADCASAFGGDVPANNALSRVDLHRILAAAAETAGAKVTFGLTVQNFVDAGSRVEVTLTDGRAQLYDLVVGFDGIRSPLRGRLFGDDHEPVFTGYAVWRVTLPRRPEVSNAVIFQGDGTKAGLIPISDESMYLLHVTPEPGSPHHERAHFRDLLVERLAGYPGLVGEIRDGLTGPDGIVYSPLHEVLLPPPWYRGRVIVLGDAAHACAPHLTQGAGMAIEDAVVLAEELAADRAVDESLAAFMTRRVERVKLVQEVSHAILFHEMAVTAQTLARFVDESRATLPGQLRQVETFLNQPY